MTSENNNQHPQITNSSHQVEAAASPITREPSSLGKIMLVASVATGIQFGRAIQDALLDPDNLDILGKSHKLAAKIVRPISVTLITPMIGFYSDQCTSRFGRRKPFILFGVLAVVIAVFLISFARDLGHDDIHKTIRPRAAIILIIGLWILDVTSDVLHLICVSLIGDLAKDDHRKTRIGNGFYSFFSGVGGVLGNSVGRAFEDPLNRNVIFSFTKTEACDEYCANIKACFFFSTILLIVLSTFVVIYVHEESFKKPENEQLKTSGVGELLTAFKSLKKRMWVLMFVTAINWVAWYPFFWYGAYWMGREVYGGGDDYESNAYKAGVRSYYFGLVLNYALAALMSLAVEPLGIYVGGVKRLWGVANFILAICLSMTVVISKAAEHRRVRGVDAVGKPSSGVRAGAYVLLAILGVPLALLNNVPYALASIYSSNSEAGQGLSQGMLNIAFDVPPIILSALIGPENPLFDYPGNLPAFVGSAVVAAISGVLVLVFPSTPKKVVRYG